MQASGSLFLLGEPSRFAARNQSVIDVIAAAGGGDVPLPAGSIGTKYVTATFNGANLIVDDLNTGFFVPAAGTVTSPGTGIFFTTSEANGGGSGSGIAFDKGTLTNALDARLLTYFDTNTFRSEERRVGKECVSTCKSRWSPYT